MHSSTIVILVGASLSVGSIGCQRPTNLPELGHVTGTVTLDGQPVAGAEIQFCPDNAKRSQGTTDSQGRYEVYYKRDVAGAVVGRHTVRIMKPIGMALQESIPAEFNRYSTLRREVKSGSNVIDLDLTSNAGDAEQDVTEVIP